jgi:glutathione synthase/RimK-type ligase-like ATP-grasp enzyme
LILAISSRADHHTQAVIAQLAKLGAPSAVLDLADFPQRLRLAMRYMPDANRSFYLGGLEEGDLDLSECGAIWWRRPQAFLPHEEVKRPGDRSFIYNESQEAFAGLWQAVDAFWVNHPSHDEAAARKAFQLRVAQQVGLAIPSTLITNDPQQAHDFAAHQGYERTVYKTFSATEQDWRETRLLRDRELVLLESVRFAPVIFQEYVPLGVDLRVTVVGDGVFPAAIHSKDTAYEVDFRMDMAHARVEPWHLPPAVEDRLRALMRTLGLCYGAIDMRLAEDGRYVFLEINPAGQWLFVEERTQQPITATLARLLAESDHRTTGGRVSM